jgi:PIN domain nuclease of toxin-antitoxin system
MYKVEKIEIVENKVFCTIYNNYEIFNSVPIEKLKLVRKNNKLYAKLKV